jgi:drug/metabolite transporter (DMT)-like permease
MTARGWALFIGVSLVWGVPYLFIKIVGEELSPGFQAFARVALASVVLIPLAWRSGALGRLRGRGRQLAVAGGTGIAIPFALVALGEEWISSSLAGVLIAAQPIFMVVLAPLLDPADRATPVRVIGMVLAVAGVAGLLGLDTGDSPYRLFGALAVLGASCSYAVGMFLIGRWLGDLPPLVSVTGATASSAILLLPLGLVGAPTVVPAADVTFYMLVLGLVCTSASVLLLFALIAEIGPTRAAIPSFIAPLVAVLLGVVALGEPFGAASIATVPLILGGSWLASRGRRATVASPVEAVAAPEPRVQVDAR